MSVTRLEVYAALDTERDYQDGKWGDSLSSGRPATRTQPGGDRTIDEFILYIRGYAEQAATLGATEIDPIKKLNAIRKVGALCVACMEQHGAPTRTADNSNSGRGIP